MRPHVAEFVRNTLLGYRKCIYDTDGEQLSILEVGSYQASEGPQVRDIVLEVFPHCSFVGLDMREGPGVDAVADIQSLKSIQAAEEGGLRLECFDIVISVDTLEHTSKPFQAVENMISLLAEDGMLVLAAPFAFQIHEHPSDYFRYTQEGLRAVLDDDVDMTVQTWQDPQGEYPHTVYAVAQLCDTATHEPLQVDESFLKNQQTVLPNDPSKSVVVASFDSPKQRELFMEKARCENASELFHHELYNSGVWQFRTHYQGYQVCKNPMDLWSYQELLFLHRPDLVIETGTAYGGSALYLAKCMEMWGGKVISIDIADSPLPKPVHPAVTCLRGSSVDEKIVQQVRDEIERRSWISDLDTLVKQPPTVMVILDSDHSKQHVAQELELYSPLVSKDSYLVVEDTNIGGHPVASSFGPGPFEAVEDFLSANDKGKSFTHDKEWLKHGVSWNTWLKRLT